MCRELIFLACFVVVMGTASTASGGYLSAHWALDDGSGSTASDSSGNQHQGTIGGTPNWITGQIDGALDFDGATNYIDVDDQVASGTFTLAMWLKPRDIPYSTGYYAVLHDDQWNSGSVHGHLRANTSLFDIDINGDPDVTSTTVLQEDEWYHFVATVDTSAERVANLYVNGVLESTGTGGSGTPYLGPLNFGAWNNSERYYHGAMDDIRVYSRVLTEGYVQDLFHGIPPAFVKAENPNPPDGAEGVLVQLATWTPGETATFHDVYFGTTPDLGPENFMMRNPKAVMVYWHAPGLVPDTTYYWRIDEVEADGTTIHTGDVWSFTVMPLTAWNPDPADGAEQVWLNPVLTWSLGQNAGEHHVYFADNFDDVNDGVATSDKGTVDEASYAVENLEVETTYYWRVDETDVDGITHKGSVWSFTTVDRGPGKVIREWWLGLGGTDLNTLKDNARYPDDPDGREFVDLFEGPVDWADNYGSRLHGWLYPPESSSYTFWIASDDLSELWLSTDEDPANAVLIASVPGWVPSRDFDNTGGGIGGPEQQSNPIALEAGKRYYVEAVMKEGGGGDNIAVAWQGGPILSREVVSAEYVGPTPYPPVKAYGPIPTDDATDVPDTAILRWNPGTYAVQHDVYFGTDANAVANADTTSTGIYRGRQNTTSYSSGTMQWNTTYYWRIDEVNPTNPDSPWKGRVWSFTTADYIVVEDFEDYNDYTPDRIWQTWRDGIGYNEPPPGYAGNGTGSQVGNDDPPFTEQTTVHSGAQAMTFRYTNDGSTGKALYSEAEREWAVPQDWTRKDVKALSVWFYGDPANSAESLYVGVQDNLDTRKDVPHPNPNAVLLSGWQEFNIELQEFANAGVNLTGIKKMYIGVGNRPAPEMGGTGTLYFDDIRLYRPRCMPLLAKPDADLNSNCVVDYPDLEIMGRDWLLTDGTIVTANPGTANLAAHYKLDGNAQDSSGNGHHGAVGGTPAWVTGVDGTALNFDGSSTYVDVSDLIVEGSFTLALWLKYDTLRAGGYNAVMHTDGWTTGSVHVHVRTDSRLFNFDVNGGIGATAATALDSNQWYHLAATVDTSAPAAKVYVDGLLEGTNTSGGAATPSIGPLNIGAWNDSERFFDGATDDFRIYDRALSDAEVAYLADQTPGDGELYVVLKSPAELYDAEPQKSRSVNLMDYAILADAWLDEVLWP